MKISNETSTLDRFLLFYSEILPFPFHCCLWSCLKTFFYLTLSNEFEMYANLYIFFLPTHHTNIFIVNTKPF